MNAPTELEQLAEDWITLWQSELAGLAADPELAEAWSAAVALGAAWWRAQAAGMGAGFGGMPAFQMPFPGAAWPWPAPPPMAGGADVEPAPARPVAAARPAAAGAAPDGQRDAGVGRPRDGAGGDVRDGIALDARLAALERRLAEIEGGPGRTPADPPAPRRRKPRP